MTTDVSPPAVAAGRPDGSGVRRAKPVVIGLLAVATLIAGFALLNPKPRIAATNSVTIGTWAVEDFNESSNELCATNQYVPEGVGGVRLFAGTHGKEGIKFAVTLKTADGKPFSSGSYTPPRDPEFFTIPVSETKKRVRDATTCVELVSPGKVSIAGSLGTDTDSLLLLDGEETGVDMHLSYMTADEKSLLTMIPTIFARAALFRPGWQGSWWFYLLAVLALAVVGLAAYAVTRAIDRPTSLSTRGWVIVIVAFAGFNAFAWSTVSPIFMPPDEPGHYAYVETIGNNHTLPARVNGEGGYGTYGNHQEFLVRFVALNIVLNPDAKQPWDRAMYQAWKDQDATLPDLGKKQGGGWSAAANYSPLYYAPAVAFWAIGGKDDVTTKTWLIRLWSVLLTMFTVALVFFFAKELFPRIPWAAPAAGLVAAFQPMLMHLGGAINNDSLLFLVCTGLLWACVRTINRGLTLKRAAGLGALLALSVVVKPTALAFVAPVGFTLGYGFFKGLSEKSLSRSDALVSLGGAAAAAIAVLAAYYIPFSSGDSGASGTAVATSSGMSIGGLVQYLRDWYLPQVDGFRPVLGGVPVIGVFVRGFFADFNSLDTHFHDAFYGFVALVLAMLVGGAVAWGLRNRRSLRGWWPQAALCVIAVVSLVMLINLRSYAHFAGTGEPFAQGRYLLPVVAVFAALVIAGAQGFKRWAPQVAAAVVVGLVVLNAFGMALSMTRFYT